MNLTNKLIVALIFIMTAFTNCEKKSDGYTINGVLNYENDIDSIYIYEYSIDSNIKTINSAPVINNKFTLKGTINVPQIVVFGNANKNFGGELILENTTYQVSSSGKDIVITGGKIHEKVLGFINKPEYQKLVKEYDTVSNKLFKNIDMDDEEALNEAREKSDVLGDKILKYEDEVFDAIINDENEDTYAKLFALVTTQNWKGYPKEKRKALLSEYEKELGNHINIKVYREFIKKGDEAVQMKESVKNGSPYKEVIAKDINGNTIALSELVKNNKYTLLEFWASWCSPCRAEIPNLKKAYKKYKKLGLEIYSVSIDIKKDEWELALKEEKTSWPNSLIEGDEKIQVNAYGVEGIPASFLIAQDGTIIASNNELREFELDRILSKLLK